MFPAWAGNICLIFWSDTTYQLFQIKFGPYLVLLGGEVQYCSEKGMGQCEIDGVDSARPIQIYDNQKHMMKKT